MIGLTKARDQRIADLLQQMKEVRDEKDREIERLNSRIGSLLAAVRSDRAVKIKLIDAVLELKHAGFEKDEPFPTVPMEDDLPIAVVQTIREYAGGSKELYRELEAYAQQQHSLKIAPSDIIQHIIRGQSAKDT